MAAPQSKLGKLHELLTDIMLEELEMYRTEAIPVPSSDKAAIAKFLKDNNITADPTDKADLDALKDMLLGKQKVQRTNLAERLAKEDSCAVEELYRTH